MAGGQSARATGESTMAFGPSDRGLAVLEVATHLAHQLGIEDGKFARRRAGFQIELVHLHPEGVGRDRRLHVVEPEVGAMIERYHVG